MSVVSFKGENWKGMTESASRGKKSHQHVPPPQSAGTRHRDSMVGYEVLSSDHGRDQGISECLKSSAGLLKFIPPAPHLIDEEIESWRLGLEVTCPNSCCWPCLGWTPFAWLWINADPLHKSFLGGQKGFSLSLMVSWFMQCVSRDPHILGILVMIMKEAMQLLSELNLNSATCPHLAMSSEKKLESFPWHQGFDFLRSSLSPGLRDNHLGSEG